MTSVRQGGTVPQNTLDGLAVPRKASREWRLSDRKAV